MEKRLTPQDIAKNLDVSMKTAYRLFSQPDFPAVKIGNRFYVKESDYEKWFDQYRGESICLL